MPVYEYQCTECGRIQEAFQKISDQPLETCPHCSGHLKKLISNCTFHLKGSGWYVTDYGGSKTGTEKKAGTGKKSDTTDSSKPKESKTASKKDIVSKN